MTTQATDSVLLKGEEFELLAANGTGLFYPMQLGMKPRSAHSGCWRGFINTYEITADNQLKLKDLLVHLDDYHRQKPFNGVDSTRPKGLAGELFSTLYENVAWPVPFSGTLMINKEGGSKLFEEYGFWYPVEAKYLYEVKLVEGKVEWILNIMSHREELEKIAAKTLTLLNPEKEPTTQDIYDWIGDHYREKYSYNIYMGTHL